MPRTVYCLQHSDHRDRETGVEFRPIAPFVARTETDDIGRETEYIAHSAAEVDSEHLDYFRSRPHLYHVAEQDETEESEPEEATFTVEERENAGWFDVVGPDGEVENEKALREDDARELADHLNETVA